MDLIGLAMIAVAGFVVIAALLDRVLTPWLARKMVEKTIKFKSRGNPRQFENPRFGTVTASTERLTIKNKRGESRELRWHEIEAVHAFKKDLLTTDLICLAFKKSGAEEYYEIHEQMAGYHDLVTALPLHLPKFDPGWILKTAFPAFATNHEIIWKRPTAEVHMPAKSE